MNEYEKKVAELKAEIATLDVPNYMLRILRINEIRTQQLAMQAERLNLSMQTNKDISELRIRAEEHFGSLVDTPAEDSTDSLVHDFAVEAQNILLVRDLRLAVLEGRYEYLEAEAKLLDSPAFTRMYDYENLDKDILLTLNQFAEKNKDDLLSNTFLTVQKFIS